MHLLGIFVSFIHQCMAEPALVSLYRTNAWSRGEVPATHNQDTSPPPSCHTQPVEAQAFSDYTKTSFPADALAVQRYVREKGLLDGHPPRLAAFFHEYR
jgi:hypothetical protein